MQRIGKLLENGPLVQECVGWELKPEQGFVPIPTLRVTVYALDRPSSHGHVEDLSVSTLFIFIRTSRLKFGQNYEEHEI